MNRSPIAVALSAKTLGRTAVRYLVYLAIALPVACAPAIRSSPNGGEMSLMQADRDFAIATHERGIDGWMSFFAPDAIMIRYRGNMVKGFAAVRAFDLAARSDTTTILNWEPVDAYVFSAGTIGSTTGTYSLTTRKTAGEAPKELGHGRYVTMWRREGDRWLVIMDTGYPDPTVSRP